LTSYTDEQGHSVHYPLIRNLGESMCMSIHLFFFLPCLSIDTR
jgi:hypothetical protein